jgi:hypothetical protein
MVSTECARTAAGTPVRPSVAVNIDFHGYLQFLCIGLDHHWKPFRRSIRAGFIVHCWKTALSYLHSAPERNMNRSLCVLKLERSRHIAQFTGELKKTLGSLGRIAVRRGRNSHTQCSLDTHRQPMTWKNIAVQHAGVNKVLPNSTHIHDPLSRRSAVWLI